jgi:hypothetical protein
LKWLKQDGIVHLQIKHVCNKLAQYLTMNGGMMTRPIWKGKSGQGHIVFAVLFNAGEWRTARELHSCACEWFGNRVQWEPKNIGKFLVACGLKHKQPSKHFSRMFESAHLEFFCENVWNKPRQNLVKPRPKLNEDYLNDELNNYQKKVKE